MPYQPAVQDRSRDDMTAASFYQVSLEELENSSNIQACRFRIPDSRGLHEGGNVKERNFWTHGSYSLSLTIP